MPLETMQKQLQSLWILLQDQLKCNDVKAFLQVSSNKYDTPSLDSSLMDSSQAL